MSDFTQILGAVQKGEPQAAEKLLPLVYQELRKLAGARMMNQPSDHTLQPTALVHEAWLRLTGKDENAEFANRAHFFSAAAQAMGQILIERARRKATDKRGGEWKRIDLDKVDIAGAAADDDTLLIVTESLEKLAAEDPKAAEIVKLRFYCGLTLEEAGRAMGFTERTAKRYWAFARAWLYNEMEQDVAR